VPHDGEDVRIRAELLGRVGGLLRVALVVLELQLEGNAVNPSGGVDLVGVHLDRHAEHFAVLGAVARKGTRYAYEVRFLGFLAATHECRRRDGED